MAIRVNADYESVLFSNKPSLETNQAIEFLAFFLETVPVLTSKQYSVEYLKHVEEITGWKPNLSTLGEFINWWGPLKDREKEKVLNSKLTSSELLKSLTQDDNSLVIQHPQDVEKIKFPGRYLLKNPYGMSGRGIRMVTNIDEARSVKNYPLIVEPLYDRIYDFSHYIYPDGQTICYQNLVDAKFQYKGTFITDWRKPTIENLDFYSEIETAEWQKFNQQLIAIKDHYLSLAKGNESFGFSIDSFVYQQNGHYKIHPLSEVNFRRTMGRVAYDLAAMYAGKRSHVMFVLEKGYKDRGGFLKLKEKLSSILLQPQSTNGVILLSPGDALFEMFLICAEDERDLLKLQQKIKELLA